MFLATMSMLITLEYLYSTSSTFPSFIVKRYIAEGCNEALPETLPDLNSREKPPESNPNVQFIENLRKLQNQHSIVEVQHIAFLKVHKAASSTVQNIFFRFGYQRNLSFVLTSDPNYFSRKSTGHYALMTPKYRNGYDILCNHGIFNYTTYSSILPKDTIYIAIVRDPLELFISAVNYYTQSKMYLSYLRTVPGNKLQNLIRNTTAYETGFYSYTRNVMARDLGFPATSSPNRLNSYLTALDRTMKLVLLVEHFEESLILMKRYLHWSLEDILFIPNNVWKGVWSVKNLTASDVDLFAKRNSLDYTIYNYFYARFWQQFSGEDPDIHQEVLYFKTVLTKVSTFCTADRAKTKGKRNEFSFEDVGLLIIPMSKWNEEFVVKEKDCKLMLMKELEFIDILRKVQGSEIKPPKKHNVKRTQQSGYQQSVLTNDKVNEEKFRGNSVDSKKYFRGGRLPTLRLYSKEKNNSGK